MEGAQTTFDWAIAVVVLVAGFAAGLLTCWLSGSGGRRARDLEAELDKTRQDLENYRTDVASHFQRTAQLFDELTDNYKTLYTHLAQGAGNLCGDKNRPAPLDMPESRLLSEQNEPHAPPPEPNAADAGEPSSAATAPSDSDTDEEELQLGDTPRISDLASARDADKPADPDRQ